MKNKTKHKTQNNSKVAITIMVIILFVAIILILFKFNIILGNVITPTPDSNLNLSEKCYIQLDISEIVVRNKTQFNLINTTNLFGLYDSSVNVYDSQLPGDYVLRTYNKFGRGINQYSLYSSRYIFYDTFDDSVNPGGVEVLDSGVITAIIPYDASITRIAIMNNKTLTGLQFKPTSISCKRTCKVQGELGKVDKEKCCFGYTWLQINSTTFSCSKCGDKVCSKYEDKYSCYEDCYNSTTIK